jgi:hypothetical protein
MLMFMPWCPINKRYEEGEITILPFERHTPIEGLDDAGQCRVNTIMAAYKDIEGKPVHKAAIVRYGSNSAIDDLTDDDVDVAQELVALACFSGLAGRDYFNSLGPYCNADCFSLHVQKFDKADFTALTTRRREGRTLSGWPIDDIAITVPVHCHVIREVSLDSGLLQVLVAHRAQAGNEWGRWQNAMSCFNQANTDSDNIRHQVEWVLLCSAFEHLLSAKPNAKDVACKFTKNLTPSNELLAKDAARCSCQQKQDERSLRYEWMREFNRIRGDFAHGRLDTRQPTTWNPLEHVLLASIAVPLLVKSLLNRACKYKLTDDDHAQIDVFERFADITEFLKPPPAQKGSLDSHWKRLVDRRKSDIGFKQAFDHAWDSLTPEQRRCLEDNPNEESK